MLHRVDDGQDGFCVRFRVPDAIRGEQDRSFEKLTGLGDAQMVRTSCFLVVAFALLVSVVGCDSKGAKKTRMKKRMYEIGRRTIKQRLINPSSFGYEFHGSSHVESGYSWACVYTCKSTDGAEATMDTVIMFNDDLTVSSIDDHFMRSTPKEVSDRPLTDFIKTE